MLNKLVVDISRDTQGIDPLPLHDAGVQLVILQVDQLFIRNARALSNSGMPIAACHWVDPTRDAVQQVAETLSAIRNSGLPVLAIFCDFEQYWSNSDERNPAIREQLTWSMVHRPSGEELSNHAKQVFEALEESEWRIFGSTRASFVTEYAPQAVEWMSKYRWWLAYNLDYEKQMLTWSDLQARILPTINFFPNQFPGISQRQVVGHHFTGGKLCLPGLYEDILRTKNSAAGVSLFDGQFLKEIEAIPVPKPLPPARYEAVVTATTLNVRCGPGIANSKLYRLKKDESIQLTEINNGWAKLRSFGEEWCSAAYLKVVNALPEGHEHSVTEDPIEIFMGVSYQKARRYYANYHVLIVDPNGKRFHVTPCNGMKTVSQVGYELGAPIVINGDGWGIHQRYPNSIAASDGNFYMRDQLDYRPWVNISRDNEVTFAWRNPVNLYNAVSGDRYLIQNGRFNEAITNVAKDPRTVIGLSKLGKLILIVADGRTPQSAGLSFREVSNILLELDAVTAINLDGGGSSAMWINGQIVNVPVDENVPGKERPVANHLCIFMA